MKFYLPTTLLALFTSIPATSAQPSFDAIETILTEAGIVEEFEVTGATAFAPTVESLENPLVGCLLQDRFQDELKFLARYHIVTADNYSIQDLVNLGTVTASNGASITISSDEKINGASILATLDGGRPSAYYLIDRVLVPPPSDNFNAVEILAECQNPAPPVVAPVAAPGPGPSGSKKSKKTSSSKKNGRRRW